MSECLSIIDFVSIIDFHFEAMISNFIQFNFYT